MTILVQQLRAEIERLQAENAELKAQAGKVLEIQLPSRSDIKYMEYSPDVEGGSFNERAYLSDFRAAIEAVGVRVKP